jgi:hypothetical protein
VLCLIIRNAGLTLLPALIIKSVSPRCLGRDPCGLLDDPCSVARVVRDTALRLGHSQRYN